ncbi:MAG TPA: phosphoribosyltransferase family protein [Candidatus Saccharimonadales bacterium]|nr:phosphoribosyltransferase family protein [Candidatus Saccharimonadales bacterium]
MYFKSRAQAGNLLAAEIAKKYRYENCAVVALSDGGVIIGAEIAINLHCVLSLLLAAPIELPNENDPIATVNQSGRITYNGLYSAGELEELQGEFRTYIEEERIRALHKINSLLGDGGLIEPKLLKGRIVILVSDGLSSGLSLEAAVDFLKPIQLEKLIVAVPIASVPAVDRMHVLSDEIYCLSVLGDYINTDHYYDIDDKPDHDEVIKIVKEVILHWK